ncbi:DUF397 domain-containing protein [Streptomyces sp. I05A-00742]|uniref:DUF397 domain-containing protein n=1 Tax=Streptomyces sp. I05A-00742 TaxID=2732853 RepID=UPI002899B240|nr:DUF397 domain-containing protein [Streptomyces sp. I05A-00742]
MNRPLWQKSSYSASTKDNECVEIAGGAGIVRIRESQEPGEVLSSDAATLAGLIRAVKSGAMDRTS